MKAWEDTGIREAGNQINESRVQVDVPTIKISEAATDQLKSSPTLTTSIGKHIHSKSTLEDTTIRKDFLDVVEHLGNIPTDGFAPSSPSSLGTHATRSNNIAADAVVEDAFPNADSLATCWFGKGTPGSRAPPPGKLFMYCRGGIDSCMSQPPQNDRVRNELLDYMQACKMNARGSKARHGSTYFKSCSHQSATRRSSTSHSNVSDFDAAGSETSKSFTEHRPSTAPICASQRRSSCRASNRSSQANLSATRRPSSSSSSVSALDAVGSKASMTLANNRLARAPLGASQRRSAHRASSKSSTGTSERADLQQGSPPTDRETRIPPTRIREQSAEHRQRFTACDDHDIGELVSFHNAPCRAVRSAARADQSAIADDLGELRHSMWELRSPREEQRLELLEFPVAKSTAQDSLLVAPAVDPRERGPQWLRSLANKAMTANPHRLQAYAKIAQVSPTTGRARGSPTNARPHSAGVLTRYPGKAA